MGVGLLLTGCKPDLTQANALAMIQAKYDQLPAAGINITVDKQGMGQGIRPSTGTGPRSIPTSIGPTSL